MQYAHLYFCVMQSISKIFLAMVAYAKLCLVRLVAEFLSYSYAPITGTHLVYNPLTL